MVNFIKLFGFVILLDLIKGPLLAINPEGVCGQFSGKLIMGRVVGGSYTAATLVAHQSGCAQAYPAHPVCMPMLTCDHCEDGDP